MARQWGNALHLWGLSAPLVTLFPPQTRHFVLRECTYSLVGALGRPTIGHSPTSSPISVCAPSIFTQERSQSALGGGPTPSSIPSVYHPGGRFSLAHKNTGVHGADLLSFSGALCLPLPPFEPHPNMTKLINVWAPCFSHFLRKRSFKVDKTLGLTFFMARKDFEGFKTAIFSCTVAVFCAQWIVYNSCLFA